MCANEIQYRSGQNRLYTSFMLSINHSLQSFPKLFVLEEYKEKKTLSRAIITLKRLFESLSFSLFSSCNKLICQRQCPLNGLLNLKLIEVLFWFGWGKTPFRRPDRDLGI